MRKKIIFNDFHNNWKLSSSIWITHRFYIYYNMYHCVLHELHSFAVNENGIRGYRIGYFSGWDKNSVKKLGDIRYLLVYWEAICGLVWTSVAPKILTNIGVVHRRPTFSFSNSTTVGITVVFVKSKVNPVGKKYVL